MNVEKKAVNEVTKQELRAKLKSGNIAGKLFPYTRGDGNCIIFKVGQFHTGDNILYIPDVCLNELPMNKPLVTDTHISGLLDCCYTGDDFVQECRNAGIDEKYAERLFYLCEWQHPSSILAEGWPDDENDSGK